MARKGIRDSRARADGPSPAEEAAETTRLKKVAFLAAFASCGRITKASEAANINPDTHYEWRKVDSEYDRAFAEARVRVGDLLEDEAIRRGREGVDEPQFGRVARDLDGMLTGEDGQPLTVKRYDSTLLALLLKGNKPDLYRERREITGKNGGPLTFRDVSELTDDELDAELASMETEASRATAGKG